MRRLLPMLLACAVSLLVAVPANAAPAPSATINVCDPGSGLVGVRARMPGGRAADRLYATIQPEWFSRRRQQWLPAGGAVELLLGGGDVRSRQTGYTFEYEPPTEGRGWAMRATVGFQWRRGGEVVRSASAVTSAGMPGSSAALCALR